MSPNEEQGKIRAAITVTPADDPAKAADLVAVLAPLVGFDLEIVGYTTLSLFGFPVAGPAIPMPISGFAIKQRIRRARTEIHNLCSEVASVAQGFFY